MSVVLKQNKTKLRCKFYENMTVGILVNVKMPVNLLQGLVMRK